MGLLVEAGVALQREGGWGVGDAGRSSPPSAQVKISYLTLFTKAEYRAQLLEHLQLFLPASHSPCAVKPQNETQSSFYQTERSPLLVK